jgi:hypothetical protein
VFIARRPEDHSFTVHVSACQCMSAGGRATLAPKGGEKMLTRDRAMMDSLPADRFVSGAMLQGAGRLRLNRYAMGQHAC